MIMTMLIVKEEEKDVNIDENSDDEDESASRTSQILQALVFLFSINSTQYLPTSDYFTPTLRCNQLLRKTYFSENISHRGIQFNQFSGPLFSLKGSNALVEMRKMEREKVLATQKTFVNQRKQ